jgi:UDP-2,3-diacylglucosamine pyrophosphatase LpxH
LNNNLRTKALEFAKLNKYDYIICGHSHQPEQFTLENITYINTGSWVSDRGNLLLIKDGMPILYSFNTPA